MRMLITLSHYSSLVLPTAGQALAVAWICVVVASMTKNEGLTSGLVILVLIALRYRR